MKFSQMPYERPILSELKSGFEDLLARFKGAKSADECFAVYREYENLFSEKHRTPGTLQFIRHSLDTTDEFYNGEMEFWDEAVPELEGVLQEFTAALLASPFRADIEAKWGSLVFKNAEIRLKTFTPAIVEDLQKENALRREYGMLMASAQIEFDGKTMTLTEMDAYSEDPDRAVRKAAHAAHTAWRMCNADKLDSIFDDMVKTRTDMAKKLGYENFVELGYYRMIRNCYDKEMVAKFRDGVAKHIVPIVTELKKAQAKRIGVDTIKVYDDNFRYPDGNAKPKGTADDIFAHAKKMYRELSDETGEFLDFMIENELFDVHTRPGKAGGGFMTKLPAYRSPFIFANFNGTSRDVDVFTHEVGHAFAAHLAWDIEPAVLQDTPPETGEIHAMAMEYLTWPWMEGFFGEQTDKYCESHLSDLLSFLPYGVMVDEYQHYAYENPEMTPPQRNEYWLTLEAKYRPWLDLADTPYHGEGRQWQSQPHIYNDPFYYIDYCLAQIIALVFWAESQRDHKAAWEKYRKLTALAGTKTFVELVAEAGLPAPFETDNIKMVADAAKNYVNRGR